MSLDLGETILQVDRVVQNLDRTHNDRRARLDGLLEAAARISPDIAAEKTRFALQRAVTLAAYVSLPRTTEVVNAIRRSLCPHDLSYCKESCGNRCYAHPPCDTANDFMDRDVFQELLQPGWRSAVAALQLW